MNSGCATGILIDISNTDVTGARTPQLAPKLSYSSAIYSNGYAENDCELLENEVFDFNDLSKSPNISGCSEEESTFDPCLLKDAHKSTKSNDYKLSTEQLAEVFKEATVVAVKLENYVQEMNRTPPRSPNLTTLLAERSAQKKNAPYLNEQRQEQGAEVQLEKDAERVIDKLDLEKEVAVEQEQEEQQREYSPRPEKVVAVTQMNTLCAKNGFRSPIQGSIQKPSSTYGGMSAPLLRKLPATAAAPVNSSLASFSRVLQQNKYRSSMASPQKTGPLKATAMPPPKQLTPLTITSPSIRKPQSLQSNGAMLSNVAANLKKTPTALTRTSSFNSAPKIPVRPTLKRRNSMASPTLVDPRPARAGSDPRPTHRSSIGGPPPPSPSSRSTNCPLKNNIRRTSSIPLPATTASAKANDTRQSKVLGFRSSAFLDTTQKLKRPKLH